MNNATTHILEPSVIADAAALQAELEAALAAGELAIDPADCEAIDLDPQTLSLDDITLEAQLSTRYHAPKRAKLLHPRLVRYENAQALARDIGPLSSPGERVHAVVNGNFIFGDFIEAWIKANNWLIPDLWLATLSLSADNIDSLANLLHGDYVQRIHLMVSDYFFAHERHPNGLIPYLYQELDAYGGERLQLSVSVSHSKITLIAPHDDHGHPLGHYVLHGSANLRSSASIEQFALEHDPDLHAFHRDWLAALETQYSTIHPEQPGPAAPKRTQWQQIAQPSEASTTAAADKPPPTAPAPPAPPNAAAAPKPAAAQ